MGTLLVVQLSVCDVLAALQSSGIYPAVALLGSKVDLRCLHIDFHCGWPGFNSQDRPRLCWAQRSPYLPLLPRKGIKSTPNYHIQLICYFHVQRHFDWAESHVAKICFYFMYVCV